MQVCWHDILLRNFKLNIKAGVIVYLNMYYTGKKIKKKENTVKNASNCFMLRYQTNENLY